MHWQASAAEEEMLMASKVFVGNLDFNTTRDEVEALFSQVGTVRDVLLPTDRESGRPRGFAFVEFESDEDAAKAIEKFNGHDLGGRALRVNAAEDRPPRAGGGGAGRSFGGGGGGRGGGGGGYSGGGGGGYGGGGGGGGSYIDSSAVAVLTEVSGVAAPNGSSNGEIIITALPRPIVLASASTGAGNFGFDIIGPTNATIV